MATLTPLDGLYSARVLTTAALDQLGSYLVSPDFLNTLVKLFNNPMDYIRGLHYIPHFFTVGATENLKIGNISTPISSGVVTDVYTSITMGSKNYHTTPILPGLPDYMYYEPYAKYSIYIPYCGWYELSSNDVVDRQISIAGTINVLTGDVFVEYTCDGMVTKTFTGNCAIQIPLTSIDYGPQIANVAASATGAAASAAAGFMAAGPAGAVAAGVVSAATGVMRGATPSVQSSGGVSAAVGYMGPQTPVIVYEQMTQVETLNNKKYYSLGVDAPINTFTGYLEVVNPVFSNDSMYKSEYEEIVELLASGVFV